jgi:hypothetical protein
MAMAIASLMGLEIKSSAARPVIIQTEMFLLGKFARERRLILISTCRCPLYFCRILGMVLVGVDLNHAELSQAIHRADAAVTTSLYARESWF